MKYDVVLAGVGGQGVLSISAIIAASALREDLHVKQSEVHGMAQRGGSVLANLRLSDEPVWSDIVPEGSADLVISMEPVESLRHLNWLSPEGTLITSTHSFVNVPDYPELESVLAEVRALAHAVLVDAEDVARRAGNVRATNMVLVGAASSVLPIAAESIEAEIRRQFGAKGERIIDMNLRAFREGRECVPC
jgi:indolepyruvate ferredoxin oxidoreductase beta subunit